MLSQREIAADIYDMRIETSMAAEAKPGQFLGIYPKDKSMLLPRPISICETGPEENGACSETDGAGRKRCGGNNVLRIVYRVAGEGTREFSGYREGDSLGLLGPLGNGFPLEAGRGKRVFLIGGGIGIPPLLELAKRLETAAACKQAVLGYRNDDLFLKEEFERYASVYVAAEDGSAGVKGNVMDAIGHYKLEADVIFACGPMPMLRAVKKYARERQIPAYISLEEHMACGVGACLGCVVKTKNKDPHSHVNNARICTDGPVFPAESVEI